MAKAKVILLKEKSKSAPAIAETTLLVPRYVRNLNMLAERCGFSVSVRGGKVPDTWRVQQFAWSHGESIISTWKGTKSMLAATGLLAAGFRIPSDCGWWCVPQGGVHVVPGHRPMLCGVIDAEGSDLDIELWGGPIPQRIDAVGEVEITRYGDGVVYHGTADALVAGNFCAAFQIPGKRDSKRAEGSSALKVPVWHSRRFPDGSIAHWRAVPGVDIKISPALAKKDRAFEGFMQRVVQEAR